MPFGRYNGRVLFAAMMASLLSILVVSVFTFYEIDADADDARADCRRAVDARSDHRSMWEYLLATNDDPESEEAVAFARVLNERLPRLVCDGNNPVPVEEP
jgi:hypothetical protein